VDAIRNSDIRWSGTLVGLYPFIEGQASQAVLATGVLATGRSTISELVAALDDPDRWIAAHALLTQVAPKLGGAPPIKGDASERWWGLKVNLLADGRVEFDPADRPVLKKYWQEWAKRLADEAGAGAGGNDGSPTGP
jgi:hypothetical protein